MRQFKARAILFIGLLFGTLYLLNACTYTTPEAENPAPGLEDASTMFAINNGIVSIKKPFLGIEINQETNEWRNIRKRWLCGWAPIRQSGKLKNLGALTATPYNTRHCNVEFHITSDGQFLEALEVNVDKPNYKDWQTLVRIPILRHYFYEKDVDSRGRELNRFVKQERKKNWELRPIIDINLNAAQFVNHEKRPFSFLGQTLTNLEDVELEVKKDANFFGFTSTATSIIVGSHIEFDVRFNFLEFKGTPGFKKTRYDISASNYMNILHIIGSRPDRKSPVDYAAHWDLQNKIEVCLNGFPDDPLAIKIAEDVLEESNKALRRTKAIGEKESIFVVSEKKMKHSFDLRCPSITWVQDEELSYRAPLGIGLANANVETGEILWGGAVIWGGLINYIVNRDTESAMDQIARYTNDAVNKIQLERENPYFRDFNNRLRFKDSPGFKSFKDMPGFSATGEDPILDLQIKEGVEHQQELVDYYKAQKGMPDVEKHIGIHTSALNSLLKVRDADIYKKIQDATMAHFDDDLLPDFKDTIGSEQDYMEELNNLSLLTNQAILSEADQNRKSQIPQIEAGGDAANVILQKEFRNVLPEQGDFDNLIENHASSWEKATHNLDMNYGERRQAARSVVKNVMLHEWGHVMGMGHQFAGNKLPEKGSVPHDHVYEPLRKASEKMQNYTSIMDYMSGHTEVALDYDDVKMQIQDDLVLHYLYNQKFATYKAGDKDFNMQDLLPGGIIPASHKGYKTTYLPQCSDIEAWKAEDPYCRRWDRGYDANSIVKANFNVFADDFVSRTNSFTTATGGNKFWVSHALWHTTFDFANHNRTFYDLLRYNMLDQQEHPRYYEFFKKIKRDKDALIDFSLSCVDPSKAKEKYQLDYAKLTLMPTIDASGELSPKIRQLKTSDAQYKQYLETFTSIAQDKDMLDDEQFREVAKKLEENDITFTHAYELCRASKKSLEYLQKALSLPGYDYTLTDYDSAEVPTGLRGGNSVADWSKLFGRYVSVGILPMKIAALDSLTSPSSLFAYGYWYIGKPKYSDKFGKYAYHTLFPEEFTSIVNSSVNNNMSFGGTDYQEAANLSIANLYMSYFLRRALNRTNDDLNRKVDESFLRNIKQQSEFKVQVVPVLLETKVKDKKPETEVYGFIPKIFNRAKRELIALPNAYVFPEGQVIVRGQKGQIVIPLTKLRFVNHKNAFIWAIEVTFDDSDQFDRLKGSSVKNTIRDLTRNELNKCIEGEDGLKKFFDSPDFKGFTVPKTITSSDNSPGIFEQSVIDRYVEFEEQIGPSQKYCDDSRAGVGLLGATALSLNGWIIPQVFRYMDK